jgi:mitochondrial fission protein ELM1
MTSLHRLIKQSRRTKEKARQKINERTSVKLFWPKTAREPKRYAFEILSLEIFDAQNGILSKEIWRNKF